MHGKVLLYAPICHIEPYQRRAKPLIKSWQQQFLDIEVENSGHSTSIRYSCSFRDGGGTITTVELGQVMTTFGWAPTEPELQELIGEI